MSLPTFLGSLPHQSFPGGVNLGFAQVVPPGTQVFYARSGGADSYDPPDISAKLSTTIADAAALCRANYGDRIQLLPGHSQSTATTVLTGLVAGTVITGSGWGSNRPTIRLTDTAAQLAISVANVTFVNCLFKLEGANGITKAINVTGADVAFIGCEFEVASGATAKSTIALEVGTGAARFKLLGCHFRGTDTHNVTDCVKIAAAVDGVQIIGNSFQASATAANGLIHVTAAATNLLIARNYFHNTHTSSSACLVFDNVACTGIIGDNRYAVEANGTAASTGVTFGAASLIKSFESFTADEPRASGILAPAVVAT